jgi:hypothetical protein
MAINTENMSLDEIRALEEQGEAAASRNSKFTNGA